MELQQLINAGVAFVFTILGWLIKAIWDGVGELRRDLKLLEARLSEDYVRRDDFKDALVDIKNMLNRIFEKLDTKMDKTQ